MGVFQGTSTDCCGWAGKLLARGPPKQQFFTPEGGCPGGLKVIRVVFSKMCEILLSSVRCIHAMNVSCLKSGAKEEGSLGSHGRA